ncbi:MAG: RIP metalloprotease RseP [Candidatus Solibacter sp.]|nr:RIP metalloprotease RseP [Candidatus Solibacter sp.]
MTLFGNIWWLLVLLGVMIIIHELGHYLAARLFDIRVDTFSIGFGPRMFGFRRGETDFRFSWILFGGYVKMAGEHPGDENDPRGFQAKPRWQRLIVVFAGPAMNIFLAVFLLTGLYMVEFPRLASSMDRPRIGYVKPDSPAARAGLQQGDIILSVGRKQAETWEDVILKEYVSASVPLPVLFERNGEARNVLVTPLLDDRAGVGLAGWSAWTDIEIGGLMPGMDAQKKGLQVGDKLVSINGKPIRTIYTVHDEVKAAGGKPVAIVAERGGGRLEFSVQPKQSDADGPTRWMLGVELAPKMVYSQLGLTEAVAKSVDHNIKGATLIFQFLQAIVERRSSPKSLEGPIRIAQLSGDAAREGAASFISLMATVSLNLAIFNLLPIPILDGGMILMLLIEMVIRRDLSLALKENILKLGFVFLMVVVVFVLYNDISKLLPG